MKLTLYPDGYAFVSRDIIVQLNQGLNNIRIENIPQDVDTHSLMFYFKDTANVVATTYDFVPKNNDQPEQNQNSVFVDVTLEAEQSGEYNMTVFYKINRIGYEIFYNFLYDRNRSTMDISGWIDIANYCGIILENVELQVIVTHANDNVVFTLDGIHKIYNNGSTHISFLSKNNIPLKYKYVVPFDQNETIECLSIKNTKDLQLGTPLMPGNIALYSKGQDGNIQHIGNDKINIYLPDEDILFEIGKIDDLISINRKYSDNSNIIDIKNITQNLIILNVEINTYNQQIQQSNVNFDIDDNGIGHVDLKIMPLSTQKIVYRLQDIEMPPNA